MAIKVGFASLFNLCRQRQKQQHNNDSYGSDDEMVEAAAPVAKRVAVTPIWKVGSEVAVTTRIARKCGSWYRRLQ